MPDRERTLVLPRTELDGLERLDTPHGPVLLWGERRPGAMRASEDSLLVHHGPRDLVLVVADGAGGHALGGEASRAAVLAFGNALDETADATPEERLPVARRAAVHAVTDLGREAITTLAIAWIRDGHVTPCHAGDSTVLLMGQRGRRKLRTTDHTPPGLDVAAGRLTLDEARAHESRHLLVNALGTQDVGWEVGDATPIGTYDTLVLGTDGLFDNLGDEEIIDCLRKGSFEDGMRAMLERNAARMEESRGAWPGKPDDVAVLAYRTR